MRYAICSKKSAGKKTLCHIPRAACRIPRAGILNCTSSNTLTYPALAELFVTCMNNPITFLKCLKKM